jgi:hypothetical protein
MSDGTIDAARARALVGCWDLTAFESRTGDDEAVHPLGPDPRGRLVYTEDGFVSVLVAGGERPRFSSADLRGGSDAEIVQAFRSFIAYSGRYRVEGDVVIHDVDVSLLPNWVGDSQRRLVSLEGDELALSTPPIEIDGAAVTSVIRWRRAGS